MSDLDEAVKKRALALANVFEKELGPQIGLILLIFNKAEENLSLTAITSTEDDGETIKILREAQRIYMRQRSGEERWFEAQGGDPAPHGKLVNAGAVTRFGGHDRVRVWSRGGLAGELMVNAGDGEALLVQLGLAERT